MGTQIESLWFLALLSKCRELSALNLICFLLVMGLTWLAMTLIHWTHPGGPAWGKYRWFKPTLLTTPIPGPHGYPVLGSMSLMASLAHHRIAAMARVYRATRLMAFSLGETRVVVTCNHEVAKEILTSSVFIDRPAQESAYSLMFNRSIGFASYGVYWSTLRRISANHLFCPKQIKSSEKQRFDIANQMITMLRNDENRSFQIRKMLKRASLDNMMCSVFGCGYWLDESESELSEMVDEGYDLLGKTNWSDHLSWLVDFDPQMVRYRCNKLVPKVNRFVGRIIDEHRTRKTKNNLDFVDVLLSLQGPDKLQESDMIAVLWEMIFRGTDTVAVLIEWILARMVIHPDVQSTVQNELNQVVGSTRAVVESDLPALVYLQAVVKEVLRLHPPGPLLSWARLSVSDTIVDGFHVPMGTTAMVNMWAITRDPRVWSDPLEFKPERFVGNSGNEFSVLGSDLRLAPFGSGRRSCPGKALGLTTVSFWVASLLHEYEFGAPDPNNVDMSEVLRLSCEMASPLVANVRPRRR